MAGYFSVPLQSPVVIFRHTEVTPILSRMKIPGLALLLLVSCLAGYPSQSACAQNEQRMRTERLSTKLCQCIPSWLGTWIWWGRCGWRFYLKSRGARYRLVTDHESTELIEFHFNPYGKRRVSRGIAGDISTKVVVGPTWK